MELDDPAGARLAMEAVDILRDDAMDVTRLLEHGDGVVARVRGGACKAPPTDGAACPVALPAILALHELLVAHGLAGAHDAGGAAIVGDAGLGAAAGAGQDHRPSITQEVAKGYNVAHPVMMRLRCNGGKDRVAHLGARGGDEAAGLEDALAFAA